MIAIMIRVTTQMRNGGETFRSSNHYRKHQMRNGDETLQSSNYYRKHGDQQVKNQNLTIEFDTKWAW